MHSDKAGRPANRAKLFVQHEEHGPKLVYGRCSSISDPHTGIVA